MVGSRYGYRPQIDGLRALAVGGVLLTHFWFPHGPMGHLGVRLFFVISGFLITERLLDARTTVEGGASRPINEGMAFFLRRALSAQEQQWLAEIRKMRALWGAPIPVDEEQALSRYLARINGPADTAGDKQ